MNLCLPQELDGGHIDATPDAGLTTEEKAVLTFIQSSFPLEPRPYAVIGTHIGISEERAFVIVQDLKKRKIIRRIGANFQSRKLGFHSTLCAAKVPANKLETFIAEVNAHTGVTHNYLRNHAYNIWFTCIGPSKTAVADILQSITDKTNIPIVNLPAQTMYKIKVDFNLNE